MLSVMLSLMLSRSIIAQVNTDDKGIHRGARGVLDGEGLVRDLARAVVDQRELQAAQSRRAHLVFDPGDLHKLLVLEIKSIPYRIMNHKHTSRLLSLMKECIGPML